MQNGIPSKTVYIIAGPTAVGKTAVAIALAQQLNTEIISADSRQCYREMTIGTAKPSQAELAEVKHYFIDEFSVTRELNAADFETLALQYLDQVFASHNTAVVCGGTGLYIKALCDGLDEMPSVDEAIRYAVDQAFESHGISWLQDAVHIEDPLFFAQGEIQNPARLIRALSFVRSTGQSILSYHSNTRQRRTFDIVKVALELPREVLYDRINHRVDIMLQQGLLDEVKSLYPLKDLKNLRTVGYTELFDYLDNKCSLDQAVDKIKQHTRNYAKRQLTWFRKDKEFHWLSPEDPQIISHIQALQPQ